MAIAQEQEQEQEQDAAAIMQQSQEQSSANQPSNTLKVSISVGTSMSYDFKNYYADPGFGAATIPMKKDKGNKKRVTFRIPTAVLGIEKTLPLSGGENMKLALEAQGIKELSVRKAYADFRGFGIGKSVTNFSDPDACGLVGGRSVQVRWQCSMNELLGLTLAVEEAPDWTIKSEKSEKKEPLPLKTHKNIPAFAARVRSGQNDLWHVQLGGLVRILEYSNTKTDENSYLPAFGVTLGTSYHLIPERTTLSLQGVYGQGIGGYMANLQDLEKEANTVYAIENKTLKCKTLNAWGAGASISHKLLPVLKSGLDYAVVSTIDQERPNEAYKYGHDITASLYYLPIKQVELGMQYLLGIRKNISGEPRDAHRVQAAVKFSL